LKLSHSSNNFTPKKKSHVCCFVYYSAEVDLTQIDPKKDPNDATSLLELLLVLMMKNFHLSAK
jgi:hypothetical protein